MASKGTAKRAPAEFRGRVYDSIVETIGATPLVRIHELARVTTPLRYPREVRVLQSVGFGQGPYQCLDDRCGRG
jgi:hypothetical protein